ncbi:MGMT family protein [Neosynechococcus sphagnicola]|uniref:MGMT family protein n=1 Tax=Neosynechococcus sphagnicola TaxID=1501145 RepID=UPI0006903A2F|nr:MGMT family protein [Neosynechococcus sphagnicola]
MSTYDAIYAVVRQIPRGNIATYGQVATLTGLPGQARLVGYALFRINITTTDVPWHRVINVQGKISASPWRYSADTLQRSLLEQEGVEFDSRGRVSFTQYLWQPLPIPKSPACQSIDSHRYKALGDDGSDNLPESAFTV